MRNLSEMLVACLLVAGCGESPKPASSPPASGKLASSSPKLELPSQAAVAQSPQPSREDKVFGGPPARAEQEDEPKPEKPPAIPPNAKPLNRTRTLFFETMKDGSRRVHLLCSVVLREGPLEVFVCPWHMHHDMPLQTLPWLAGSAAVGEWWPREDRYPVNSKEHESVLHCEIDAREVHMALVAAKAVPGTPVKYAPKYEPATGTKIRVTMTYYFQGELQNREARYFVRDSKTKKEMAYDWVFAGSRLQKNPTDENEMFYYANNGEMIALSNFPDSMLDLPVEITNNDADLQFEAWTERIPPRGTMVLVTLEPVK